MKYKKMRDYTHEEFVDINNLPEPLHDGDMVEVYIKYIKVKRR